MGRSLRWLALLVLVLPVTLTAGYRTSSWIVGYDPNSLTSTQLHAGKLVESNPVWYEINSDGTLRKTYNSEDPTWRAAMSGTEIFPTVQNLTNGSFDKAVAVNVISTAAKREAHAENIRQLVQAQSYEGIDIDYESLPYSSRANFTAFIELLAQKLHANGKKLSVTVYAQTTGKETWDGAGAQDYVALGAVADTVKIMIYPYHYSGTAPGPLCPLDWLDKTLIYAKSTIAASKIIAGLPWYGKEWVGTKATSITSHGAATTAKNNNATVTHPAPDYEATYKYSDKTVFYTDGFAYNKKIDLVVEKHGEIGGFAHWVNGSEDAAVWSRVEQLKNGSSPAPPTNPPLDPSALSSSAVSSSDVNLNWTDNSGDESGFRIERCTGTGAICDAAPAGYAQIAQVVANTTSYSDRGLTGSTTYAYRVRSYNSAGNSGYSNSSASTTPEVPPPPPVPTPTGSVLVPGGDVWRYLDNGSDQGTVWRAASFSDTTWSYGPAQLGYGDGDERTLVGYGGDPGNKHVTTYFRYAFSLADPAAYGTLTLKMIRDDGAVVYLNGTEVWRNNMPTGTIGYRTFAAAVATDEATWLLTTISPSLLTTGINVVAVEVHQSDAGSSDISFDFEMTTVTKPGAPGGLVATTVSASQIDLTWADNSSSETGFKIERCAGAGCTNFAQISTVGANVTSFSDTGLAASTSYSYRVRAYDSSGDSGYSNVATAVTLAAPAPPPPPPPPPPSDGTLIVPGSIWRYLDNGSDQGTGWRETSFDESAWRSGAAQLGYGDGDENTVVGYGPSSSDKFVTTYFRHAFEVTDPASYTSLTFRVLRDDGAVVYLNGTEVWRSNMPAGMIGYRTYASGYTNDESVFFEFTASASLLVAGRNVVAVEVHQSDPGSSDVSFDLELKGSGGSAPPPPPPSDLVAAPGDLNASAKSSTRIDLTWSDNSSNETSFRIERCSGSGCSNFTAIATVPAGSTSYSDTGLTKSTSYTYRVQAIGVSATSPYSNTDSARTWKKG